LTLPTQSNGRLHRSPKEVGAFDETFTCSSKSVSSGERLNLRSIPQENVPHNASSGQSNVDITQGNLQNTSIKVSVISLDNIICKNLTVSRENFMNANRRSSAVSQGNASCDNESFFSCESILSSDGRLRNVLPEIKKDTASSQTHSSDSDQRISLEKECTVERNILFSQDNNTAASCHQRTNNAQPASQRKSSCPQYASQRKTSIPVQQSRRKIFAPASKTPFLLFKNLMKQN
jgi:hypothetical protein